MRCHDCRRTGFTQEELEAHVEKTGHKLHPDPAEWGSPKEFEETAVPQLGKEDLKKMFREMLTPALIKELIAEGLELPPRPADGPKGGHE